jgi:tetrahydromethanopterin S-methyltransferase subunit E
MAVCEVAVLVVHYFLAVVLASCYSVFLQADGSMTGGLYYAVQAKYMAYYYNNGSIMESVTVLFAGGLVE